MDVVWDASRVDAFVDAYVDAALWDNAENFRADGITVPGDEFRGLLVPVALDALRTVASGFVFAHGEELATWLSPEYAGYLLWLNQNGHGHGFWGMYLPNGVRSEFSDHAWSVRGDRSQVAEFDSAMRELSDAAKALGGRHVYVGQDSLIHVTG